MPAVYVGVVTVAGAVGGMSTALTAAVSGLAIPIAELQLQASAAVDIGAQFSAGLSDPVLAVDFMLKAGAEVMGTLALEPPALVLQGSVDASADLALGLDAKIGLLNGFIDLNMMAALNTGGLYAFTYTGDIDLVGTSFDGVTPVTGQTGDVLGVLILAKTPEAQASLRLAFGIT